MNDPGGLELPPGGRPRILEQAGAPRGLSVLVLAPHPDDFDQVAVVLRRLARAGASLRLAVLSSSANGVEDAFVLPPTDELKAAVREEEQRRSLAFFGLESERWSLERLPTGEGGFLTDEGPGRATVRRLLAETRCDVAVMPHGRDTNPDHRLVAAWWRAAADEMPRRPAGWMLRDPKTTGMRLDLVVPFDEAEAAWKAEMLRFHRSQQERGLHQRGHGLDERILRVNRDTARQAGLAAPYAEGFEIVA